MHRYINSNNKQKTWELTSIQIIYPWIIFFSLLVGFVLYLQVTKSWPNPWGLGRETDLINVLYISYQCWKSTRRYLILGIFPNGMNQMVSRLNIIPYSIVTIWFIDYLLGLVIELRALIYFHSWFSLQWFKLLLHLRLYGWS